MSRLILFTLQIASATLASTLCYALWETKLTLLATLGLLFIAVFQVQFDVLSLQLRTMRAGQLLILRAHGWQREASSRSLNYTSGQMDAAAALARVSIFIPLGCVRMSSNVSVYFRSSSTIAGARAGGAAPT